MSIRDPKNVSWEGNFEVVNIGLQMREFIFLGYLFGLLFFTLDTKCCPSYNDNYGSFLGPSTLHYNILKEFHSNDKDRGFFPLICINQTITSYLLPKPFSHFA